MPPTRLALRLTAQLLHILGVKHNVFSYNREMEAPYRLIPLSRGLFAKVSPQDFEWLSQWKWNAMIRSNGRGHYAVRCAWLGDNKVETIYMHRLILGLEKGDRTQADHRDLDPLNNTRENLRKATQSQNGMNRPVRRDASSGTKGIRKDGNRWCATCYRDGKQYYLGSFKTVEEAREAYQIGSAKIHGEFSRPF